MYIYVCFVELLAGWPATAADSVLFSVSGLRMEDQFKGKYLKTHEPAMTG